MMTGGLAKRYANALVAAAVNEGTAWKAAGELRVFGQLCAQNGDLGASLSSLFVPAPAKKRIISGLLAGKASPLAINFLCLLVDKKRFGLLAGISAVLDDIALEKQGIMKVKVASALQVEDQGAYLRRRLEKWLGKKVLLEIKHEPSLLSGIQICIGDRFFDGSGLGRLAQIRAAFSTN